MGSLSASPDACHCLAPPHRLIWEPAMYCNLDPWLPVARWKSRFGWWEEVFQEHKMICLFELDLEGECSAAQSLSCFTYSWGWRHRPAAPFGIKSGSARTSLPHCICQQLSWLHVGLCWCWSYVGSLRGALLGWRRLMFDQNRGSVGPCWGYVGAITRWAGLCWPILGLCWGYVGPAAVYVGGYVGAMLAHLLTPRRWFWGYVVFMSSPSFPKFTWKSSPQWPARHPLHLCNTMSLKKLNPAWDGHTPDEHLKAPTSGLRVAGPSDRGGRQYPVVPPLAKLDFLQRRRGTCRPLVGAQKQVNLRQRIQTWDSQHVSSVFAPTSGLRVAGGGRRLRARPHLAKLDFFRRWREMAWNPQATGENSKTSKSSTKNPVMRLAAHFERFCSHQWPASRRRGSAASVRTPFSKARFASATAQPDLRAAAQCRRPPERIPKKAEVGKREATIETPP